MIFQEYMPYGFTIGTFLPGIIGLLINIPVAYFITKDAQKRGMEPTVYVLLTCCCGWLIGGIIYLVTASNHPVQTDEFGQPTFSSHQGQVYGQPQQQTTYGQQYQHQRQPVQPPQPKPVYPDANTTMPDINSSFCPICGSKNDMNGKFCSHCGADLK